MTRRAELISQQQLRKRIFSRGETVYRCDVCSRKIRIPLNRLSFDTTGRCVITKGCAGHLHKVILKSEANETSTIPPSVPNLSDWSQRRMFFLHNQPVENETWTVEHNLSNKPNFQVFITKIEGGEEVLVETDQFTETTIDLNTSLIEFTRREKGLVQCLATASANSTNQAVGAVVESEGTLLITNGGEITVATIDSNQLITLTVRFKSSIDDGSFIDITYDNIDDQASIQSPWVGANVIYVGGKSYTIRSFNLLTHPNAVTSFTNKQIGDGTQFFFVSAPTIPRENLILLGTPPFQSVDKTLNKYIDIALINQQQPELAYASGEAYASAGAIKTTYPPIHIVD